MEPKERLMFKNEKRDFWQLMPKIFAFIMIAILTLVLYIYAEGALQERRLAQKGKTQMEYERTKSVLEIEKNHVEQKVQEIVVEENTQVEEEAKELEVTNEKDEKKEAVSGYQVIAYLEIPQINLVTNVLEKYSQAALNVSVTKFFGPDPNEAGNFCITGHNYITQNMFRKLKDISIGDSIFLTDKQNRKVEYIVYDVFKVTPKQTQVLSQKTNGAKEITLITCTQDSKLRIIVKGKAI